MARKSVEKIRDAADGCAVFAITAESKGETLGPAEVTLPTRKATFAAFVKAMGGEETVRKLAMDAKIIRVQAALRANGRPTVTSENDLD